MKNIFVLCLLVLSSSLLFGCRPQNNSPNTAQNSGAAKPAVKENVKPAADSEIAIIDTEYGKIKIELYSNIAPNAVERFKSLAKEGFYNGQIFHRVNPRLGIIQGGDPQGNGMGKSSKPDLQAELSDIPFDTGIVGAARSSAYNSANSQFFIMSHRQAGFDKNYTVFGKVIEGQNAVNIIANAPTAGEKPLEDVHLKSVIIENK